VVQDFFHQQIDDHFLFLNLFVSKYFAVFFQVEELQGWNFNLSAAHCRSVQQASWLGLILLITKVLQQGKYCV